MGEPVSLEDAKKFLGVRTDHRDDEIVRNIAAARGLVEDMSGVVLARRVILDPLDGFGGSPVRLARRPVNQVLGVRYLDANGELQEMLPAPRVVQLAVGPVLLPTGSAGWPVVPIAAGMSTGYVEVELDAGYGDPVDGVGDEVEGKPVPEQLVHAILLLVGHWFENHEGAVVGTTAAEVPLGVKDLCRSFRSAGLV